MVVWEERSREAPPYPDSDKKMKQNYIILLIVLLASSGCVSPGRVGLNDEPMSIIALPEKWGSATIKDYVTLQLPYGIIVSNADTNSAPSYYLFSRNKRTILKTHDIDMFLAEVDKLPDGASIDMISKCTVPFHTQYGVNIDEQYKNISALLERKRFRLVTSLEDDERHASFCYCENGFIILEKPRQSEQTPAGDALKAAPKE